MIEFIIFFIAGSLFGLILGGLLAAAKAADLIMENDELKIMLNKYIGKNGEAGEINIL